MCKRDVSRCLFSYSIHNVVWLLFRFITFWWNAEKCSCVPCSALPASVSQTVFQAGSSSTHMLLQTGCTAILYSRGGLHILSRALITVGLSRFSQPSLAAFPSAHSSIKLLPFLYYSGFIIFSPSSNSMVLLYDLAYPQLPDLFLSLVLSSIPGLSHPQWREVQQVWLLLRSSGCSPSVHARVCADLLVGMVGVFTVGVWGCISMCLAES